VVGEDVGGEEETSLEGFKLWRGVADGAHFK
jgi:hypothetical protein